MTSPTQRAANQLNALRSTGPKSPQGKQRTAANAIRHGLTVPVWASTWAEPGPALYSLLMQEGFDASQAHQLAACILDYERNLEHQRQSFVSNQAPEETAMAQAIHQHMPVRGSPISGVSRQAAQSSARFLLKIGARKQRDAEQQLRNADRHLRRAANQLVKQCKACTSSQ